MSEAVVSEEVVEREHPAVPWWGWLAVAAFVGLVVCGYVATAVAPNWANDHPAGLLALNARIRHLLLAIGGGVSFWTYAVVAAGRLALAFVVCHLIGRAYSERVLDWFGKYLGYRREQMDALVTGVDRVDWAIVPFFAGSNLVAAISGVRKMHPLRLGLLLTIGLVGRVLLYWWIGQAFEDQLSDILDWIGRYQWPLTVVSIATVLATVYLNFRRGKRYG